MKHFRAIDLRDNWVAWDGEYQQSLVPPAAPPAAAMRFNLPMDVRTALFRAQRAPDARLGRNSIETDWIVRRQWWFATTFSFDSVPRGKRVYLRTRGVDYVAEFFVNGLHVGSSVSFNRVEYLDITAAIRAGSNDLSIRLWSCYPDELESPDAVREGKKPVRNHEESFKAVMFMGGDHNPFLYNAGLAQAPQLIVAEGAILKSVGVEYRFDATRAKVSGSILVHADSWADTDVSIEFKPRNFAGASASIKGSLAANQTVHRIDFADLAVEEWMPFHLGFPHCYTLTVNAAGQSISTTTGFRSIEKRHNPDFTRQPVPSIFNWHSYENNGPYAQEYYKGYDAIAEARETWPERPREGNYTYKHFVNDRELFVMGGSVVPPTLFWADWDEEIVRRLVRRARESNNNTLRIWGGGYLSLDEFFDEADLQGVMVSHDFPNFFTNCKGSYSYQQQREAEFRSIMRQISAHPSVVIMNGGNELLQSRDHRPLDPLFFIMDRVVKQESTNQLFHWSSPMNPEVHGPWYFDLDHAARYASMTTIFNSECGCQGAPSLKSLKRAMNDSELNDVFGETWLHRMCDPGYFSWLVSYSGLFGPAKQQAAGDAVRQTQLVQAMAYQFIAEEFRRKKPATSGFTTWEYNEPWIDVNWGILSNDLICKHSFFTFKRACAPVLVSARFDSYVVSQGETFAADLFLSAEGRPARFTGRAQVVDSVGKEHASIRIEGTCEGPSIQIGRIELPVPAATSFVLKLSGNADGAPVENDYAFVVLPPSPKGPRVLILSGEVFENLVIFRYFQSAGFRMTHVVVDPSKPLDATRVDLSHFDVVVIAPIFNPIASLGRAFLKQLRGAIESGLGLCYFAYNTSAYVSGRYDVDELRGSALESLLPVRFAENVYGNSEEKRSGGKLVRHAEHVVWSAIDTIDMPPTGIRVGVAARDDATTLATSDGEPVLVSGRLGKGIVNVFTGPYGGHNYQEPAFRSWGFSNRLLSNIVEHAATGAVRERSSCPHPFEALMNLPAAKARTTIEPISDSPTSKRWKISIHNEGLAPLMWVDVGNTSDEEGESFDWIVSENRFILLAGESRTIEAEALARAAQLLPPMQITVTAWNRGDE